MSWPGGGGGGRKGRAEGTTALEQAALEKEKGDTVHNPVVKTATRTHFQSLRGSGKRRKAEQRTGETARKQIARWPA